MYLEYWQLKERPFENVPDPRFFYLSNIHQEALMRLLYTAREEKLGCYMIGVHGCGKTTVLNVFEEHIKDQGFNIISTSNPLLPWKEFLKEIVYRLGVSEFPQETVDILHIIEEKLVNIKSQNIHTLLIIDEAHLLGEELMEELRLLLNIEYNNRTCLSIILSGQPELSEKIDSFPQFKQRLPIRYFVNPLDEQDTKNYIEHRLKIAGAQRKIFDDACFDLIYEFTGGNPRSINNLCDIALLIGMGKSLPYVDTDVVKEVIEDLSKKY